MGQSKQTSTNKSQSDPWKPAQPYLTSQMSGAAAWRDNPNASQAYSGPRVAGMSSPTQQGVDYLTAGHGTQRAADYLGNVVNGDYLNANNPWQADLDNSIKASVMPSINSTFSASGMTGASNHVGALSSGLANGLAAPRYANYQNERAMQQQAAGMMPGVENARAGQLLTAGQTAEGYDQRAIEAEREAFEENRLAGLRPYLETQGIFGQIGSMGGTSSGTSTQTSRPSLGQQIIGAGMMGASLMGGGGMFGGGGGFVPGTSMGVNAPYGTLPWQTA